jgi:beta-glucosidase/6-phospho-beta-glucosidase/beta-galactosidase
VLNLIPKPLTSLLQNVQRAISGRRRSKPAEFPESFLFGASTADHQCEAYDPRYPDTWDTWEATHSGENGGSEPLRPRARATDFWNRYPEDIQLAKAMGCSAFRFSISWARVEPEPGHFSEENIEHYRQVAEAVRAAGMEPVVTLLHFVWPVHVEQRGGLLAAEFPRWFAAYAERMRDALGDLCRYWITINEPNALQTGYAKPFWASNYCWPPGLPPDISVQDAMSALADVMRNVFLAHCAARQVIRSGPGGEERLVSVNSYYLGLPLPLMRAIDHRASSLEGWAEADWALFAGHSGKGRYPQGHHPRSKLSGKKARPSLLALVAHLARRSPRTERSVRSLAAMTSVAASNWWQLGMLGRLPEFICPAECVGQQDFVAVDYYFGSKFLLTAVQLLDVMQRRFDKGPIWSGGLGDALRYHAQLFPHLPLFVMENGFAGRAEAQHRARYLRRHIRQVQRARAAGVNVIGYFAWSLTTNREWGLCADPRGDFGFYHIDLDGDPELTRHLTPIAEEYAAIIRARGVQTRDAGRSRLSLSSDDPQRRSTD